MHEFRLVCHTSLDPDAASSARSHEPTSNIRFCVYLQPKEGHEVANNLHFGGLAVDGCTQDVIDRVCIALDHEIILHVPKTSHVMRYFRHSL